MFIIKYSLTFIIFPISLPTMDIRVNLDVEMAKQKISLTELSQRIGISMTNLSLLKTGKVKAIRFSTLSSICHELGCQPGDILEFIEKE